MRGGQPYLMVIIPWTALPLILGGSDVSCTNQGDVTLRRTCRDFNRPPSRSRMVRSSLVTDIRLHCIKVSFVPTVSVARLPAVSNVCAKAQKLSTPCSGFKPCVNALYTLLHGGGT